MTCFLGLDVEAAVVAESSRWVRAAERAGPNALPCV
jgi:hypothetical protein